VEQVKGSVLIMSRVVMIAVRIHWIQLLLEPSFPCVRESRDGDDADADGLLYIQELPPERPLLLPIQ
jgi:hypothetical protein